MTERNKEAPRQDDALLFAEEDVRTPQGQMREPWKLLVVDDEEEVHSVTRMVLNGFAYDGRGLTVLSAYSAREAERMIREHPDTALILLDVVMETDHAGLALVRHIREELANHFVQIVLRTGQPGQAPEQEVITRYDINDYKEKTELTAQKLFTTVSTSLRAYANIRAIDRNRKGLEQIIESSASLFELQSLERFAAGLLTQLTALFHLDDASFYAQNSGFAATTSGEEFRVIAATGEYAPWIGALVRNVVSEGVFQELMRASQLGESVLGGGHYIGFFETKNGSKNLLYLQGCNELSELDSKLLHIFETNIAVAFDNIYLNQEIVDTQREVILTLGDVLETRSRETVNHVRRVAAFAHLLALKSGLDEKEAELVRCATPMHDVGKVGVSESVLNKHGKLTPEEHDAIKAHASLGHNILKKSPRQILHAAAVIALQHHERWDGKGYPQGLRGEEIHVYGRIVGLADVFDALSHGRTYKEPWNVERIIAFLRRAQGNEFDPRLVEVFLANLAEFVQINEAFPDEDATGMRA